MRCKGTCNGRPFPVSMLVILRKTPLFHLETDSPSPHETTPNGGSFSYGTYNAALPVDWASEHGPSWFYAKLVAQWARAFQDSQGTVRAATGDQLHGGASRLQRPGLRAPANRRSRERDHACARSRGEATDDRSVPTPPFAASQPYVTVTDNGGRTGVH